MLSRIYSFKFIIGFALLWLGALAYGLAIYSTHVYRDQAIEAQIESIQSLLEHESSEAIQQLYDNQEAYALKLQTDARFREALELRDTAMMEAWLDESYTTYQSSGGSFELKAVIVRDLSGEILAHRTDDGSNGYAGCPSMLQSIGGSLIQLLTPKYSLCNFGNQLFSEVLVPVGVPEPMAYLHTVANATEGLKRVERSTGMPLKIIHGTGGRLYQSERWVDVAAGTHIYPSYRLYSDDAFLGATISAAVDQQPIIDRLSKTETSFFFITTVATVSALVLVLILLNRAFMPMNKLRNSVGALLTGKYASISEEKLPRELKDLVVAYNEMVEGLEEETISRRQIEEKLRSEKDFISTTLDSITNPVIVIDSKDRIKLVNPSAEKLFGDQQAELIDTSIHEILILYANRQTTRIVDLTQLLSRKLSISSMFFYDPDRNIVELEFSASPMIDMEAEDVGYVIILKDVSEDRKLRRKLSYEGSHDQLTAFLNRTAFEQ